MVLSIQQQIGSRSSVDVTYTRRWYDGFFVVDNLALQPSNLTPFSIVAPLDPRLPGGGGYVVSGLYDVVPEKAGEVDNFVTDSTKYGAWHQYFNGIDVTFNLRASRGLTLMVGTSTGQTVADSCDVRAHLPELATTTTGTSAFGPGLTGSAVTPVSPYCHVAIRHPHAAPRLRLLYRPEGGRASGGNLSKQARPDCWRPTTPSRMRSSRPRSEGISRATRPTSRSTSWSLVRCTAIASIRSTFGWPRD